MNDVDILTTAASIKAARKICQIMAESFEKNDMPICAEMFSSEGFIDKIAVIIKAEF